MAQDITRRNFLASAVAAGAIATAAGTAFASEANSPAWDEEQDVVILGSGCAGKSAAIQCALDGVTPLVLESMGIAGGDLMLNSGMMCGHGDRISKAHGIEITDEEVMAWVESQNATVDIYSGDMEPDVAYIVHTKGGETIDWLADQGVVFEDRVEVEAHYCPLQMFHYTGGGYLIAAALDARMEELGIETRLNSRGCKLFQDETGRVVGVRVMGPDGEYNIHANKAVILATGGYTSNADLLAKMVPSCAGAASFACTGAQGDGIIMAVEVGAATRRLNAMPMFLAAIDMNSGQIVEWSSWEDGGIAVDFSGNRFVNESHDYVTGVVIREIIQHCVEAGEDSFWMVCNYGEAVQGTLDLHPAAVTYSADSIEELCELTGLPYENLQASIDKWNGYVDAGEDPDFGRDKMMHKIEGPKYFAANVQPRAIMTLGGIRTDADARVTKWASVGSDLADAIIPGLYAAGEVAEWNARGGYAQSMAYTMGRIAGANAAKE